jgi:tetratricopeptide (TPR) repeat protein
MPRKIKVAKKKANEPDEFISTSSVIVDYVKNNYRVLINGAVIVLVLFLILFGWFYYTRGREKDALNLYNQAKRIYQSGTRIQQDNLPRGEVYRSALEKFEEVYNNYSDTASATAASLYLGDCYYHLKEYDKAIDYYMHFIDTSGKNDYLRCFAFEGLGYCYEEQGNYQKALDYYKASLQASTGAIKELLYLNVARCYEALNDRINALEFYKKVVDGQSSSLFLTLARDKIVLLKN